MKRARSLFNQIVSYENIRLAWLKARRRKSSKAAVMSFARNVGTNLLLVQKNLKARPTVLQPYHQFTIYEPKERVISVVPFMDRVMHHAIMNVLEPVFERQLIFHTYACRKGKGTHRAIAHAHSQTRKFRYCLKLDIKKYFDSIDHNLLKAKLQRIIKDRDCLQLLSDIIESFGCARGLPIGNLTSQFFANYYLSELDHYILEELGPCGYVRYMDDFLVFGHSKTTLREQLARIESFCKDRLLLQLKPFVLADCRNGVPFLGYLVSSRAVRLTQQSKKRKRMKFRRMNFEFDRGLISRQKYMDRVRCLAVVYATL